MESNNKYTFSFTRRANLVNKTTLIIIAKILITVGLLFFLIKSVEYDKIVYALSNANLYVIGVVVLLGVINIYLQYTKWNLTSREVLGVNDKSKSIRSLFYGFSAGIITPLRVGEYFGRGIEFKDKSLLQVTLATLVDKFFPLLIVALLGSVSSLFFIYFYYQVSLYIVVALFIITFTLFYILILLLLSKKFWNTLLFSKIKSSQKLKSFFDKIKIFQNLDRKYFYKMFLISFLFYSCFLIQYALLVSAFSNHYDYFHYLWAANLIMFTKTVIPPISLGELGIREGASVYYLTQMGESASVAFNASILLFIINLLFPALIGVGMFFRKNGK
ncbi:MAG: lysylphosphatidylglycerol synthase transmembrane domain-containing protein [Ignavibacteriaceae bacterium]